MCVLWKCYNYNPFKKSVDGPAFSEMRKQVYQLLVVLYMLVGPNICNTKGLAISPHLPRVIDTLTDLMFVKTPHGRLTFIHRYNNRRFIHLHFST